MNILIGLSSSTEKLPSWITNWAPDMLLETNWGQNSIMSIIMSLVIVIAAIVIGKILYWAIGKFVKAFAEKTKTA